MLAATDSSKILQLLLMISIFSSGISGYPQLVIGPLSDTLNKLAPFSVNPYLDAGVSFRTNHYPLQGFAGVQLGYPWEPKKPQTNDHCYGNHR